MHVARRDLGWVVAIAGAAILAGLALIAFAQPRYVATAKLLVERETASGGEDDARFVGGQIEVLRSQALAARAVDSSGLAADARFFAALGSTLPDAAPSVRRLRAAQLLSGSVRVERGSASGLVAISAASPDARMSAKIVNAVAAAFIESEDLRDLDVDTRALRRSLADQLRDARTKLAISERELQRQLALERPVAGSPVAGGSLVRASNKANEATADRIAAENRWRLVAGEPVLAIPAVLEDKTIQDLLEQRNGLQADMARARGEAGKSSLAALEARLSGIDSRIETIGRSIKQSIREDYKQALEREQSVNGHGAEQLASALADYDRSLRYNALKRAVEIDRARYDTLLDQSGEIAARAQSTNAVLVSAAEPPVRPVRTELVLPISAAMLSGLLAAAFFVIVRAYLDDRLRGPADVERKLGLPLLGLFPPGRKPDGSAACRSLVANLGHAAPAGFPRSLYVASAKPGEGADAIAHAIAENLAGHGVSVLLIDAHVEQSSLHNRVASMAHRTGLAALLAGQASLDEAIASSGNANLDYLPAFAKSGYPPVRLTSDRLSRIVDQAVIRYNTVIVDGPPVLLHGCEAGLAYACDGTLLVVGHSGRQHGAVSSTNRCRRAIGSSILGIVLTGFEARLSPAHGGNLANLFRLATQRLLEPVMRRGGLTRMR